MSRWFRHYAGMVRDDKLVRAAVKSGQPIERVVWIYAAILESAAEIDDGGRYDIDHAEIAYFLRADESDIGAIQVALADAGRVAEGCVVKWRDRQFQSDRSAARTAAYRERQRQCDGGRDNRGSSQGERRDGDVTSRRSHGDAPETETETEKKEHTPLAGGSSVDDGHPPEEPKPSRPSGYPEEFEELWREYRIVGAPNATKADAFKAWKRLSKEDQTRCLWGLADYVLWVQEERKKRPDTPTKHLSTFINRRGWESFQEEDVNHAARH